jgi:NAD+ synthase
VRVKPLEIADHVTRWLGDYAERAGARGFIVGISGGIDSAVTSTLAAMTARPVVAVTLPIHQHEAQLRRARDHIRWLESRHDNVSPAEVELTGVVDALVAALPEGGDAERQELSLVNARARLRMTTLYYFAALHRDLVVGTGNKVEDFGIGFFTKYGDGGVDLSPIADLTKTEVYALADALDIIDDIQKAPPTDGLWGDNRTDEDQIGASYPELEWAMEFSGDENSLDARQREVLAIFRRHHAASHHKMVPIPVCKIPADLR